MPKTKGANNGTGNGGIMDSGIFGLFGTTIQCSATDESYFCMFMKFFNVLVVGILIIVIFYTIYTMFIAPYFKKRR
jgi:hypothetical protein